ncbi:MAG: glycoside hydrolase family 3 C-terminal domain-containing protein [Actinobacteria bacterium]|nr:glycoside hydrolase family 3 C-terminal domain-containing protein [Actinomycetota bacterium]
MRNETPIGGVWGTLLERLDVGRTTHPQLDDGDLADVVANELVDLMSPADIGHIMTGDDPLIRGTIAMARLYNDGPIVAGQIDRLGLPGVRFSDGPRGVVIGEATSFPVPMARAATFLPELEERVGEAIGIEAVASGANLFAGVCVNVLRHPAWGRAQETYGEDPHLLGQMGRAVITGSQRHVMTCVKHFAANSVENSRWVIDVQIDERDLNEIYLPHFRDCVDAGVDAVMSAYNKVNGIWAGEHHGLLTDVLKESWGFRGFVLTDFLFGVRHGRAALRAGQDMEMPFAWRMRKVATWMAEETRDDVAARVSAHRIVRSQLLGALRSRSTAPERYSPDAVGCDAHVDLAQEVARQGIVLLRNTELDGRTSLPLRPDQDRVLAICGPLARGDNTGDHGSSWVHAQNVTSIADGLSALARQKGMTVRNVSAARPDLVETLVRGADCAVVVVGLSHDDEGEFLGFRGGDRSQLDLSTSDKTLIRDVAATVDNTIVVLIGGAPILVDEWLDSVASLVMAWYPGHRGGDAIAEILFGDAEPAGRLPCTWPRSTAQLPPFKRWTRHIRYGPFHGYRHMIHEGYEPQFWFGFGLGYASAHWGRPEAVQQPGGGIEIKVPLSNSAERDATEVVQLYVDQRLGSATDSVATLAGFTKLVVPAGGHAVASLRADAATVTTWRARSGGELVLSVGPSADPATRWIAREGREQQGARHSATGYLRRRPRDQYL